MKANFFTLLLLLGLCAGPIALSACAGKAGVERDGGGD